MNSWKFWEIKLTLSFTLTPMLDYFKFLKSCSGRCVFLSSGSLQTTLLQKQYQFWTIVTLEFNFRNKLRPFILILRSLFSFVFTKFTWVMKLLLLNLYVCSNLFCTLNKWYIMRAEWQHIARLRLMRFIVYVRYENDFLREFYAQML